VQSHFLGFLAGKELGASVCINEIGYRVQAGAIVDWSPPWFIHSFN